MYELDLDMVVCPSILALKKTEVGDQLKASFAYMGTSGLAGNT